MREKHSRTENNKIVRVQNVETIITLLQRNDPATTELLVSRSGLSYPTVFGIVKALLEAGIVEQQG
ncbi:MAG: winged helix-turn-helix transcriptional regulator, partial [Ruminiclostridium sp.]|nr:winged helix-turn-helix transcriptional regulator [Ruminiclostridium sp.]